MGVLVTLLLPLEYLNIRHPLKRAVDRWCASGPAIVAGVVVGFWQGFNIFGSNGLVIGVNGLLQILAGFFITSLAVIATFSGTSYRIDDVFEGEPAILNGELLTRRQFLCHLFAYLALISIFLYLTGILALSIASSLHQIHIGSIGHGLLRAVFSAVYISGLGHMIGSTMIGLIFLASRMTRVSARDRFQAVAKVAVNREPAG